VAAVVVAALTIKGSGARPEHESEREPDAELVAGPA